MFRGFFISVFLGLLLVVWGWITWNGGWFSSQEGIAHLAKASEWFRAMCEEGGPVWWTPLYQGGTSLAPHLGTLLSWSWLWGWSELFGVDAGIKLALLLCVPVAAGGCTLFVRGLPAKEFAAIASGLVYAASPALWVRMFGVEHFAVAMALAVLPYAFFALQRLLHVPSPLAALHAAIACSALALTSFMAFLFAAPIFAAYVMWGFWKRCGVGGWMIPGLLPILVGGFLLLGVLPNLPAQRESASAVGSEFSPLGAWQQGFASKSGIHWLDRQGALTRAFRPDFFPTALAGAYYPGGVALLCLALVLLLGRRLPDLLTGEPFSVFRMAVGLAFFAFWLSHGSFSVLSGTLRSLETSAMAADWMAAVLWLMLVLQGWLIAALLPPAMPLRKSAMILLLAVYFLVPGFGLISWIPYYSEIRAPFDFYLVGGAFWMSVSAGLAAGLLYEAIARFRWRRAVVLVAMGLCAADFYGLLRLRETTHLGNEVQSNFTEAVDFLRDSQAPGGILALSGRYFYLTLPTLTGRPLVQEAFQNDLQQRSVAALQVIAHSSIPDFLEFLRMAGVRYLFVERKDPDLPKDLIEALSSRLPEAFANPDFKILEVPNTLAPAYLARDVVLLTSTQLADLAIGFEVAAREIASIGPVLPGESVGVIEDGKLKLSPDFKAQTGRAFEVLSTESVRRPAPGTIQLDLPGDGGWVVIPEAWHRDWRASAGKSSRGVYQAFGGFLAVENTRAETLVLVLSPPWWYAASLFVSGGAWLLALGVCGSSLLPSVRKKLEGQWRVFESTAAVRREIKKPLVITPTYNESSSLPALLEGVFAARDGLDVLVVDDASPDGTADLVRGHPFFGRRLFLLERTGKLGLGSAYREGFEWAKARGYDACVEIDADLSHDPNDIPRLLDALSAGRDAAIGSRYLGGLRVVNWPEHRLLVSAFGTQFVRFFTGMPLSDATSGFKALRMEALARLDWQGIRAEGYAFQVELHHALWKSGAVLVEVPITFTERREGKTKMTVGIAFEAMTRVFELTFSRSGACAQGQERDSEEVRP